MATWELAQLNIARSTRDVGDGIERHAGDEGLRCLDHADQVLAR